MKSNICETAVDYRSAIEKINIYSYDCILLDLTLPGGDGMEILRAIKKINKRWSTYYFCQALAR
ncbi:response regulator [Pedobacter steynii]